MSFQTSFESQFAKVRRKFRIDKYSGLWDSARSPSFSRFPSVSSRFPLFSTETNGKAFVADPSENKNTDVATQAFRVTHAITKTTSWNNSITLYFTKTTSWNNFAKHSITKITHDDTMKFSRKFWFISRRCEKRVEESIAQRRPDELHVAQQLSGVGGLLLHL